MQATRMVRQVNPLRTSAGILARVSDCRTLCESHQGGRACSSRKGAAMRRSLPVPRQRPRRTGPDRTTGRRRRPRRSDRRRPPHPAAPAHPHAARTTAQMPPGLHPQPPRRPHPPASGRSHGHLDQDGGKAHQPRPGRVPCCCVIEVDQQSLTKTISAGDDNDDF